MFVNIPVHDPATRLQLAIEELAKNPGVSQREIARLYGVPQSTLQARLKGRRAAEHYHQATQRLNVQEEQALIDWIERMTAWGWPPRIQHLEGMAKSLLEAKNSLGQHWYKNFLNRHLEFKTKYTRNLDQSRKDAGSSETLKDWFELYKTIRAKYGVADEDIYNMDEKGFAMGIGDSSKVIINRKTTPFNVHSGNRDWVSLIECISSRGTVLPAYIIFPGVECQPAWFAVMKDKKDTVRVSPNGWTDAEIGLHWLQKVFDKHTKSVRGKYRMLIVDGHESHISIPFQEFCAKERIISLCLSPHSTHLLQPLDVGIFGPLSKAYKRLVSSQSRYGVVPVSKLDFLRFIQVARKQAITTINIMSAWRGAGLIPFSPGHVLGKLPRSTTHPTRSETLTDAPKTVQRIQEASDALISRMTPSSRAHVELLKTTALNAVADRVILKHTNQELIAKQAQRRQKASRKGGVKARVLTVGEGQAIAEEKTEKGRSIGQTKGTIPCFKW